jgi:hypothetical protein
MKTARTALRIVGVLAVLIGLVWIGQGTGYFPYPRSSFMIDQIRWAYYGGIIAVAGVIAIFAARRS